MDWMITVQSTQRANLSKKMASGFSTLKSSRPVVLQSMKKQRVESRPSKPHNGIGGEFACPFPQIADGGPNASGRLCRLVDFYRRTSMSRPHVTRVSRTVAGRQRGQNNRGIRSGRERSSPTWGHGCRGDSGRRKSVDLVHEYESPPEEFPPFISSNLYFDLYCIIIWCCQPHCQT
jgi:hypothetical protein